MTYPQGRAASNTTPYHMIEDRLERMRAANRWYLYKVTPERYQEMLIAQDYRCAICGRHQDGMKLRHAVDHDHSCCPGNRSCGRCIRGLICQRCNGLLAWMESHADSISTYLKKEKQWPA